MTWCRRRCSGPSAASGDLRDPGAFRSWLVAIAIRQVRDSYRDRLAQAPAVESEVPSPDFADVTIQQLGLSGQRRETAEATRWLDDEDRPVLALWWQEAAGELRRADLADALGLPPAHAAVRVARMKDRLATSRSVVRALRRVPPCERLAAVTAGWDGEPSPLWRKRLARHVRDCPWCLSDIADMVPAERLLGGLPLLPVPAALAGGALTGLASRVPGRWLARGAARPGLAGDAARPPRPAAAQGGGRPPAQARRGVPGGGDLRRRRNGRGRPRAPRGGPRGAERRPRAGRRPRAAGHPAHLTAAGEAGAQPAPKPTPAVVTTARKGSARGTSAASSQALAESGASWYYDWAATPDGITAPAGVGFVPMIWAAANVTTATLDQVGPKAASCSASTSRISAARRT